MRIALIHAVALAMRPVEEAFARHWPDAHLMHLLDDSLSRDRARDGVLTPAMTDRLTTLARYAVMTGADAVQFTCSAFGPAIEATARAVDVPVLKPNEAMFHEAIALGDRIGLLASFAPSVPPMAEEFAALGRGELVTACAPDALTALQSGDGAAHDTLLAAAATALAHCDAIMLAQFSTARARDAVHEATGLPVLTSPDSAVAALRAQLNT